MASPQFNDPYFPDTYEEEAQNVCKSGYVRVMCTEKSACLQIREDIIQQSQVMAFLASARDPSNPSECIHLANSLATAANVKIICNWLNQHFIYEADPAVEYTEKKNYLTDTFFKIKKYTTAQDKERLEFDNYYFLLNDKGVTDYKKARSEREKLEILDPRKDWLRWCQPYNMNDVDKTQIFLQTHTTTLADSEKSNPKEGLRRHNTYQKIQELMIVANFLELHPTEWHVTYAAKEVVRLNKQAPNKHSNDFDPVDKFAENPVEICCNHLGDMINSCSSPVELQLRFPELIGPTVLTAYEKAVIIKDDLWIHGDDSVKEFIDILREEDNTIPEWTLENTLAEREFMTSVDGFKDKPQPIKVPPIATIIEEDFINCYIKEIEAVHRGFENPNLEENREQRWGDAQSDEGDD